MKVKLKSKSQNLKTFKSAEEALWYIIDEWHGGSISRALAHVKKGLQKAEGNQKLINLIVPDIKILERMRNELLLSDRQNNRAGV